MANVAAVVVTFNRLEKLQKVIASIEEQTTQPEYLILVDNASTDGTREYLQSLETNVPVDIVLLDTNQGGAGGFSAGMRRAYELGSDFAWIMDDDGYPEPDALEKLVDGLEDASNSLGHKIPFACSLVKFTDGEICEMNNPVPTWDWGRLISKGQDAVLISQCSFVSVLIPRWVIQQYGLPLKEYFIWFDDAEYTRRISAGHPGIQVLSSITVHDMETNQGVNWGMVNAQNIWKFEFGARNQASYHRHHRSIPHFLIFVAQVRSGLRSGRVEGKLRRRIYRKLWEGFRFNPAVDHVE